MPGAREAYDPPLMISINVSSRQLQDPGFVRDVQIAIQEFGLDARTVMLEITEGSVIHRPEAALERMKELKDSGVLLAIDDFGTGYSALSYLRDFPIDVLKIDKAFTDGVASGGAQTALATAIVTLGSALSLRTLAEGVENEEQRQVLVSMGCDLGQGFHFSRPVLPGEIDRRLTQARVPALF
jgi:EAL domain-containing protein (putative c-di-GMP-specific phosphodiesterase class I)